MEIIFEQNQYQKNLLNLSFLFENDIMSFNRAPSSVTQTIFSSFEQVQLHSISILCFIWAPFTRCRLFVILLSLSHSHAIHFQTNVNIYFLSNWNDSANLSVFRRRKITQNTHTHTEQSGNPCCWTQFDDDQIFINVQAVWRGSFYRPQFTFNIMGLWPPFMSALLRTLESILTCDAIVNASHFTREIVLKM